MKLKKGDIVVIAVCVLLFFISLFSCFLFKPVGKTVKIYENNRLVYSGSLNKDKTVKLSHNKVTVKDGKAYMEKSDCKNQICVKSGEISKSRECVVCLPNKVVIEIE